MHDRYFFFFVQGWSYRSCGFPGDRSEVTKKIVVGTGVVVHIFILHSIGGHITLFLASWHRHATNDEIFIECYLI